MKMNSLRGMFASLLCLAVLCACAAKAPTWQEQYDLGMRYLTEGNYDEAIVAFTAAIEIDPKRAEAYEKLSEAYLATGDTTAARRALEDGIAATGAEQLQTALDRLPEDRGQSDEQPMPTTEEESYDFEAVVSAEDLDVQGENLSVSIQGSRSATITISGIDVQNSYLTNLSTSDKNAEEYMWGVKMLGAQGGFQVATACWAFEPGRNESKTADEMQHSVWLDTGDVWKMIGDAAMSHTDHSITWSFTVPEEYTFDFAGVERYEVETFNISSNSRLHRVYTLR